MAKKDGRKLKKRLALNYPTHQKFADTLKTDIKHLQEIFRTLKESYGARDLTTKLANRTLQCLNCLICQLCEAATIDEMRAGGQPGFEWDEIYMQILDSVDFPEEEKDIYG